MENTEFEHQSRAYANYTNYFQPKTPWISTLYKDLYSALQESLSLTKVSLGDYFFEQFLIKLNDNLDRIEKEVNSYVQSQNYDDVQKEFIFYHKPLLENRINELINKNLNDLNKVYGITNLHSEMFSNNGFELFEHILSEYVKQKNITGRYEDLSYYYRCLFEDKFIHQKPEPFRLWFMDKYTDDFSKIKTKKQTTSPQRKKDYSTALDWFSSQN